MNPFLSDGPNQAVDRNATPDFMGYSEGPPVAAGCLRDRALLRREQRNSRSSEEFPLRIAWNAAVRRNVYTLYHRGGVSHDARSATHTPIGSGRARSAICKQPLRSGGDRDPPSAPSALPGAQPALQRLLLQGPRSPSRGRNGAAKPKARALRSSRSAPDLCKTCASA